MKRLLLALLAVVLLGANDPIGVSVTLQREANDLLAPVTVLIVLRNTLPSSVLATFLTTDTYQIEVLGDREKLWDSLYNQKATDIERRIPLHSGSTPLVSYIWDATTNDHRSLAPGKYTLRVNILGSIVHPTADVPLVFSTPTPIQAALALKAGSAVTVQGEEQLLNGTLTLADEGGSIRMNRGLGPHPQGQFVVRGFIQKDVSGLSLQVSRFAPAFDNPQGQMPTTPTPLPVKPTPSKPLPVIPSPRRTSP